jgi:indolepyruvate ferredoxin oxidoreductase, alpha subunit
MIIQKNAVQSTAVYASTIDAIAFGLTDGGTQVVTGYPGFHAQEIIAAAGGTVSINEQTAYAIAWGAALAGQRSAVVFKNVGLNDAADPFVNSMNLRTSAGFTVIVLDDVEVAGSQCRQDSRHFFDLAPGLWLEPISAAHAYDCARNAARYSEELSVPVVIRLTNQTLRSVGKFRRRESQLPIPQNRRDPAGCVAHPMNVAAQRNAIENRAVRIRRFVETQFTPALGTGTHTIAVGATLPKDSRDHCHVWTYPLPIDSLRSSLRAGDWIEIFEAGSHFATEKIQAMFATKTFNTNDSSISVDHSSKFRSSIRFEALFGAIRSFGDRIVVGDLGSYTIDPHRTIDACLCYGVSVATAIGCSLSAKNRRVFCVTGDAAFLHSGKSALEEAAFRGVDLTIVVIDNGGAASTGGQAIPAAFASSGAEYVISVDHEQTLQAEYRQRLEELSDRPGVTVLHVYA